MYHLPIHSYIRDQTGTVAKRTMCHKTSYVVINIDFAYPSRHTGPDVPQAGKAVNTGRRVVASNPRHPAVWVAAGDDMFGQPQRGDSVYSKPLSHHLI